MARGKTSRSKPATATPPGLGLGLDLEETATMPPAAAGPARAPEASSGSDCLGPVSVSVPVPALRPADPPAATQAIFSVAVSADGWAVSGQIPGSEPTLILGTEAPEVQHGAWVQACVKAMREVTFANFNGQVEIRVPHAPAVGFMVVTLPTTERSYRNFKGLQEERSQKCPFPRLFREFLMLYLRLRPRIRWA